MTAAQAVAKRAFDLVLSALGLVVLSPVLVLAAVAVGVGARRPILFRQTRVGRDFRPFRIVKLRTMVADAERRGGSLSVGDDPRITPVGRVLRRFKLDELPQLLQRVRGRHEPGRAATRGAGVRRALSRAEYTRVLRVRPGHHRPGEPQVPDEAALLAGAADPAAAYVEVILPDKMRLAEEYVRARRCAST